MSEISLYSIIVLTLSSLPIILSFMEKAEVKGSDKISDTYLGIWISISDAKLVDIYKILMQKIAAVLIATIKFLERQLQVQSVTDFRTSWRRRVFWRSLLYISSQIYISISLYDHLKSSNDFSIITIHVAMTVFIMQFVISIIFELTEEDGGKRYPLGFNYAIVIISVIGISLYKVTDTSVEENIKFLFFAFPWFAYSTIRASQMFSLAALRGVDFSQYLQDVVAERKGVGVIGLAISFAGYLFPGLVILTFLSFFIGSMFSPSAFVPNNLQFIIVNALCDALSIAATFRLSVWAISEQELRRFPIFLIFDLLIAAALAFVSGYVGLFGGSEQITVIQCVNVIIGISPEGEFIRELGPLFWAVHTTFLPTLLLLMSITASYLLRLSLEIILLTTYKGATVKSPYGFTASLIAMFIFIVTVFVNIIVFIVSRF